MEVHERRQNSEARIQNSEWRKLAILSDPRDGVYSHPVTVRKILRVLVIGFSAVIVLLMAAGFIGLKSAQLIQENSAEIVHGGLITTRLIDELQREQETLNAAFDKLSRGPELYERERLLTQLDDADQAVERIVSEAAGTRQAQLLRQLSTA